MLEPDKTVYAVYEYGGEWEDSWNRLIGVCETLEKAEELKASLTKTLVISEEEYYEMLHKLYGYERMNNITYETELEGLVALFPEYDVKDLKMADEVYGSFETTHIDIIETSYYK